MKRILLVAVVAALNINFISCRETTEKEVEVREAEQETADKVEEKEEGVLERAGKKVDEEVNKEIDEEIEKIGDNNK